MLSFDELYARARAVVNPRRLSDDVEVGGVGAAVLAESGQVYTGVCIDTSCSMGFCAEHAAIAALVTAGESGRILRMVAVGWDGRIMPPCGRCREFARQMHADNPRTEVLVAEGRVVPSRTSCPLTGTDPHPAVSAVQPPRRARPMKIVAMRNEDLPALLDLIKVLAFHPIDEAAFLRMNTIEDLTSPEDLRLLAWQDDRLVGFLLGCVRNVRNTAGPVGVIKLFGVHPAYRRRGIATALFDEVERRFAARGWGSTRPRGRPALVLCRRGAEPDGGHLAVAPSRLHHRPGGPGGHARGPDHCRPGHVRRGGGPGGRGDRPAPRRRGGRGLDLALVEEHFSPGWRIEVADMERHSPWPVFVAATAERVVGFAATEVSGRGALGRRAPTRPTGARGSAGRC